jgi:hypothetical protein
MGHKLSSDAGSEDLIQIAIGWNRGRWVENRAVGADNPRIREACV